MANMEEAKTAIKELNGSTLNGSILSIQVDCSSLNSTKL